MAATARRRSAEDPGEDLGILSGEGGIEATTRLYALLIVAFSLISAGSFTLDTTLIAVGALLVAFAAFMRGYTALAFVVASRAKVIVDPEVVAPEGERVTIRYTIKNGSWIPVHFLEMLFRLPQRLGYTPPTASTTLTLPPKSVSVVSVTVEARIGRHVVSPPLATVRDPLGLFRSPFFRIGQQVEVRGIPRLEQATLRMPLSAAISYGAVRSRSPGSGTEFLSTRPYRPGDELRRIVWKSIAAGKPLSVKEFEAQPGAEVIFIVALTEEALEGPKLATPYEHAARLVASAARYLARRGYQLGLIVLGRRVTMSRGMLRGVKGYMEVLRVFSEAELEPMSGGTLRVLLEPKEIHSIVSSLSPKSTTLYFFLTYSESLPLEELTKTLASLQLKHNVRVFVPMPPLPGGYVDEAEVVYLAKLRAVLEASRKMVERLKRQGVRAEIVLPKRFPTLLLEVL
ncbi:MAG: DUF58 domain-containing protein [Thermoproteota archaeon]